MKNRWDRQGSEARGSGGVSVVDASTSRIPRSIIQETPPYPKVISAKTDPRTQNRKGGNLFIPIAGTILTPRSGRGSPVPT